MKTPNNVAKIVDIIANHMSNTSNIWRRFYDVVFLYYFIAASGSILSDTVTYKEFVKQIQGYQWWIHRLYIKKHR